MKVSRDNILAAACIGMTFAAALGLAHMLMRWGLFQ